jgi:hypothetical protein
MLLLLATLLQLLTPVNSNAYKENLEPFATIDFSRCRISLSHYIGKIK